MRLIPAEIKKIKQWTYSFSSDELKRPTHTDYEPGGALTFAQAKLKAKGKYLGFYVTPQDPYLLMDLDNLSDPAHPLEELPVELAALLSQTETYSEVSPSGKGLRIILKLPSIEAKALVDGQYFKVNRHLDVDGQINFGKPWQTITGNATPFSKSTIGVVELEVLDDIFRIYRKGEDDSRKEQSKESAPAKVPPFASIVWAVNNIPVDQNPRIIRAYKKTFNANYGHYDFWLKVLMGIHNYYIVSGPSAQESDCLALALEWSHKDKDSFESDEDVLKHWRSFTAVGQQQITYKTLFALAYGCVLRWPMPKKRTKADVEEGVPIRPIITEYRNFKALIDFYDIKMYRDAGNPNLVYLTGDDDMMSKNFKMYGVSKHLDKYFGPYVPDTLVPAVHVWAQRVGFIGISPQIVKGFIKYLFAEATSTVNLFKEYFDTPYKELPEGYKEDEAYSEDEDQFEKFFNVLQLEFMTISQEEELDLYRAYCKKWLMGLVRNLYYANEQHTNNCVLLLTGREQIRKTSFFKYLLPPFMRDKIAFTPHGFATESSMRDVLKLTATNLVVIWDELEQFLKEGTESNFKKIIDGNPQKIIDKYEVIEKYVVPVAIYGATSNLREFKLGQEGSRRIFHIPVKWVATEKLEEVCWHRLINDLRQEIEWFFKTGKVPWLLTEEQLAVQSSLHTKIRSRNSIDIMLAELYNFDDKLDISSGILEGVTSVQTDKSGRLMTRQDVMDLILRYQPTARLNAAAVEKSLERLCGDYTDTRFGSTTLHRPRCVIKRGLARQHQYKRWVMPPMRQGINKALFRQFFSEE